MESSMTPSLANCRVRITAPPQGGYQERLTSLVRFDGARRQVIGAPIDVDAPGNDIDLVNAAREKLSAMFASEYEPYFAGCEGVGLQAIYDPATPLLSTAVELRAIGYFEFDGQLYRADGLSTVTRTYFDAICDRTDIVE
jgi:hypothetical protein